MVAYVPCRVGQMESGKRKGQVEARPGPLGRNPPTINNQPLLIIFWLSEVAALPSFAHKPRVPKRWPLRPRS